MFSLRHANSSQVNATGERLLQKDLNAGSFQVGAARQLWQLVQVQWPYAVVRVGNADNGSRVLDLRLNLEKYPVAPPLVQLWDLEAQTAIEAPDWPEPFIRFASQSYPELIDLDLSPYCLTLLRVSVDAARRRSQPASLKWDAGAGLTQVLLRASECFRRRRGASNSLRVALKVRLDRDRNTSAQ